MLGLDAEVAIPEKRGARDARVLRDLGEVVVGPPHVLEDTEPIDDADGLDRCHKLQRPLDAIQQVEHVAQHQRFARLDLRAQRGDGRLGGVLELDESVDSELASALVEDPVGDAADSPSAAGSTSVVETLVLRLGAELS